MALWVTIILLLLLCTYKKNCFVGRFVLHYVTIYKQKYIFVGFHTELMKSPNG